jgi:hypothetical protein
MAAWLFKLVDNVHDFYSFDAATEISSEDE